VIEVGSHRQLLERGGLYAHLYEIQFATHSPQPSKESLPEQIK
jgi:hypothetical protein